MSTLDAEAINVAAREVHQLARRKGWYECRACGGQPMAVRGGCNACNNAGEYRNPAELIALIHSEASEAIEALRVGHALDSKEVAVELADIIIRTLDMAAYAGIDIGNVIAEKHEVNKGRAVRHGKMF